MSDLHLEFRELELVNHSGADVLVLSGDICTAQDLHDHPASSFDPWSPGAMEDLKRQLGKADRFRTFFKSVCAQYKDVIYVMGNHEHYHGKFDRSADYLREEFNKMNLTNIHLLDNNTKLIGDVHFIGGTLWTDMNNHDALTLYHIEHMMNDFRIIRIAKENFKKFLPKRAVVEHIKTKQYIQTVLQGLPEDAKVVVCTHHAPTFLSIGEQYKDDTLMNGGYASNLSEFILDHPRIKIWTHGHMHQKFDYMIGDTRVVCNPRGYPGEIEFDDNFTFEV
jgi:predicted phosphodiesterase